MKERLTGAIILVAVLVLLVPELLSGPGEGLAASQEGAEGNAAFRSYTIDLADDESRRATAPTSAATVATDEPVAAATPEPDPERASLGESEAVQSGAGAENGATAPSGDAAGSAAVADAPSDGNAARGAPPSVEDDQPRSAFGPNAVRRPKPSTDASSGSAKATGRSGKSASPETPRPAASEAKVTKGWAVQLGVFASRDNAERLAKQVKGKGYTVSVNETSGNGKRLYRVRVGPEGSRPAAVELGAKLRAAGYTGSVVAWP